LGCFRKYRTTATPKFTNKSLDHFRPRFRDPSGIWVLELSQISTRGARRCRSIAGFVTTSTKYFCSSYQISGVFRSTIRMRNLFVGCIISTKSLLGSKLIHIVLNSLLKSASKSHRIYVLFFLHGQIPLRMSSVQLQLLKHASFPQDDQLTFLLNLLNVVAERVIVGNWMPRLVIENMPQFSNGFRLSIF
jgi:hypothetical protein